MRWQEEAYGDSAFSSLTARVRTGLDSTPLSYNRGKRG